MTLNADISALTRALARGRTEAACGILVRTSELIRVTRPRSPLWLASRHGDTVVVQWLLEHGSDPHAVGWDGCSCCLPEKPIHVASRHGHAAVVEILRPHHVPLGLVDACALGERDRVVAILRDDPAQANAVCRIGPDGRFALTPSHWAIFSGRRRIFADLLDAGADVRPASDLSRRTLMPRLSLALCRGFTDMAEMLIHAGDVPTDDAEICISFAQAAYGHQQAGLDLLLKHGFDINARRTDGEHCAFVHVRHPRHDSLRLLLDNGVEVNAVRRNGKSMLHIAAARGLRTCAATLLEHGADPDIRDQKGLTALDYARGRKNQRMYEYLVERGLSA